MTLQQMKYIIAIVQYGSITEASKRLFITQPSLSNAVKDIETETGIEIFQRSVKGITLTSDGTEFLDAKSYSIFWDYLTADFWPS